MSGVSMVSETSSGSSGSGSGSGASIMSGTTTAALTTEYEVWRRWEDCLWFQDLLETQYAQMSREKVKRLQAGKGVKKNGVYPHEDPHHLQRAASFESLPPGPDPSMIAKDVHEFLPRLTKKGTLFKASKDTIAHRGQEFKALIETLLKEGEDVPTLIVELRQLRVVRDFFGFWRRDHDRLGKELQKNGDKMSTRTRSDSVETSSPRPARNSSVFGSSFGMYFSASNLSLQLPSTFSLPADSFPPDRRPRRPPIMQGGKGAMLPVSPTQSEPAHSTSSNNGSGSTLQVPRPRAQTLQGTGMSAGSASGAEGYSSGHSIRSAKTNSTSSGSSQSTTAQNAGNPPASAPAGVSFTFKMHSPDNEENRVGEEGYISDSISIAESTATYQASVNSRPPRSAPPVFASANVRRGDGSTTAGKASYRAEARDPVVVEYEDGDDLDVPVDEDDMPFDEDDGMLVMREHEHLIPEELQFSMGGRLQDLTIEEEEDEREEVSTLHDYRSEMSHSDAGHLISRISSPTSRAGQIDSDIFEEEPIPRPIPRAPRRVGSPPGGNRNGMFFTPTDSFIGPVSIEESDRMSFDGHSIMSATDRPRTPGGMRPRTPMSPPRSAARAEAFNTLTADNIMRVGSPGPLSGTTAAARRLTTSTVSTQASSRSSGSSSNTSLGTHAMAGRPISLASMASCADIDRRMTSSPIVLHTPLYEQPDEFKAGAEDQENGCRTATASPVVWPESHRTRGSVSSIQSFMTDCSADAVIPRQERSMSPPPVSNARTLSQLNQGANLRRSFSSGSRPPKRTSNQSMATNDDSEELVDAYFYGTSECPSLRDLFLTYCTGFTPQTNSESSDTIGTSPGREQFRGGLVNPDNFPKPFQNRPAGQFHLPWSPSASQTSPPTSPNNRNSVISMDASIAPSMMSSILDEAHAISIKAAFGDHIVVFRADRGITLEEVRSKIHHKLVNQQNLKLSENFILMYKPNATPSTSRPGTGAGRARSSSVSSVGTSSEPLALRLVYSQNDWQNTVNASGAKITLHIINA